MGNSIMDWLKMPFSSSMSVGRWFLFVLLVMVIVVFWTRVIRDISGEI